MHFIFFKMHKTRYGNFKEEAKFSDYNFMASLHTTICSSALHMIETPKYSDQTLSRKGMKFLKYLAL